MRDVTGEECIFCEEKIRYADEGKFCDGCRHPVHEDCMRPEAATGRDHCSVCGADLQAARNGDRQPGQPRRREEASPGARGRRLLGVIFLVLAFTCTIPGISVVMSIAPEAPDVSRLIGNVVGAFLPSLICAIIGLWLLR